MPAPEDNIPLRRIVTGNNVQGRSTFLIDGGPAESLTWPSGALHEIWKDDGSAIDRTDPQDRGAGEVILAPSAGGVTVRWFVSNPVDGASVEEQQKIAKEALASMGGTDAHDEDAAQPGMHLTKTMDVVVVQSGRIKLILDDGETILGPGDVVVQRGTNHAWETIGNEPAVMLAVLVDRDLNP